VGAIHVAVLAEVDDRGYAAATYDGVAQRAGTSKPVLYRRWPTKAQMVLDAVVAAHPGMVVPPDTGSLAGDLRAFLTAVRSSIEASGRRTMLGLLADLDAESGAAVGELLFAKGAGLLEPLVARARDRGELGDSPVPAPVVLLPLDLVRHELLVVGTLSDERLDVIVEEIAVPLMRLRSREGVGPDPS
jgi:AcrR family transcriptional regulator